MTTRRQLLNALGAAALAAPLACFAQQRAKIARIGFLEAISPSAYPNWREALIAGLRELGLVDGKNVTIEYRWAEGNYERLPRLAAGLVRMQVDVILAATAPAIHAALQATTTIPIVMVRIGDPVGAGFVASLARPGRNITGLSNMNTEIIGKYLELLRIAIPRLARVAVLANPENTSHVDFLKRIQASAKTNRVEISSAEASTPARIETAMGTVEHERAGALIVLPDSFLFASGRRIAELAAQERLPTMFTTREAVETGALMSYGQNIEEHFYRAATYIDKILKGAKPGDLPVEQPTKLELVINLKTAKAIGLTIPQGLLFRADKVIE